MLCPLWLHFVPILYSKRPILYPKTRSVLHSVPRRPVLYSNARRVPQESRFGLFVSPVLDCCDLVPHYYRKRMLDDVICGPIGQRGMRIRDVTSGHSIWSSSMYIRDVTCGPMTDNPEWNHWAETVLTAKMHSMLEEIEVRPTP